jgi:MYXO-CTERM domain-containing protein
MYLAQLGSSSPDRSIAPARIQRAILVAATVSIASLAGSTALADQFVVVDSTWDHTPDLADSHYRVVPLPGTPADWKSPVDYASGTAHVRLEVFTKPTDQPTKFQVCFEATPTYACTDQSPTYTTVGVIDWETPFANFWSPPGETVDWTKGTNKIALILKDTKNGKPSADNVGAATAALYTPTQVRMVVTIVAPGSTYVPPPPPDAGVPLDPDAGGTGVDGGSGAGGGNMSTATGAGGGAMNGNDAGAAGGAGGAPSVPNKSESGCSVTSERGAAGHGGWVSLVLAALLLVRRRRGSRYSGSARPKGASLGSSPSREVA